MPLLGCVEVPKIFITRIGEGGKGTLKKMMKKTL
jgi:hypothetical protein